MNKSDLIDRIVATGDGKQSKTSAERALDTVIDAIKGEVAAGGAVTLVGFGTFKCAARKARSGHNPATGAAIDIPAATVPKFVPGSAFKDAVNAAAKPKGKK
jgi:DNA-binding protein HU-beta